MHGDELGAVHERPLHLNLVKDARDAREHVSLAEHASPRVHERGDAEVFPVAAVADELEEDGRDEGARLRVVESQAAGEALLRE